MPHKRGARRIFILATCLAVCCLLSSCGPDLGQITDITDYEKKFTEVEFVKSDLVAVKKSVGDLYNDTAVNDFNKEDFNPPTESDMYKYMAVVAGEKVYVDEFVIYVRSEEDVTLVVYVYKAEKLPETIATGGDGDKEPYEDETTGEGKTRLKSFDEPNETDAIAKATVALKKGKWTPLSVVGAKANDGEKTKFSFEKDEIMLFQFANNRVKYDEKGEIIENEYPSATICFTAMLIRVV